MSNQTVNLAWHLAWSSLKQDFTAQHFFLKFHVVQWSRRSFSLQSLITLKTPQSQVVIAYYT